MGKIKYWTNSKSKKSEVIVPVSLGRPGSGQNKSAEESDRDVFWAYLSLEKIEWNWQQKLQLHGADVLTNH